MQNVNYLRPPPSAIYSCAYSIIRFNHLLVNFWNPQWIFRKKQSILYHLLHLVRLHCGNPSLRGWRRVSCSSFRSCFLPWSLRRPSIFQIASNCIQTSKASLITSIRFSRASVLFDLMAKFGGNHLKWLPESQMQPATMSSSPQFEMNDSESPQRSQQRYSPSNVDSLDPLFQFMNATAALRKQLERLHGSATQQWEEIQTAIEMRSILEKEESKAAALEKKAQKQQESPADLEDTAYRFSAADDDAIRQAVANQIMEHDFEEKLKDADSGVVQPGGFLNKHEALARADPFSRLLQEPNPSKEVVLKTLLSVDIECGELNFSKIKESVFGRRSVQPTEREIRWRFVSSLRASYSEVWSPQEAKSILDIVNTHSDKTSWWEIAAIHHVMGSGRSPTTVRSPLECAKVYHRNKEPIVPPKVSTEEPRNNWSEYDDMMLALAVKAYETSVTEQAKATASSPRGRGRPSVQGISWAHVQQHVPGKTNVECRERYVENLRLDTMKYPPRKARTAVTKQKKPAASAPLPITPMVTLGHDGGDHMVVDCDAVENMLSP
eukprot:TRINITY_DN4108_c0_g1_i1.p1 TRINITY_DN4108_c0_g1~~TRINITY_DN4108_c0_g1_i1.p1  ORF type:complete len:551 (+),score=91.66 TRINITY_DN4108_c0_g1_i1:503-2155(+)